MTFKKSIFFYDFWKFLKRPPQILPKSTYFTHTKPKNNFAKFFGSMFVLDFMAESSFKNSVKNG